MMRSASKSFVCHLVCRSLLVFSLVDADVLLAAVRSQFLDCLPDSGLYNVYHIMCKLILGISVAGTKYKVLLSYTHRETKSSQCLTVTVSPTNYVVLLELQ